MTEITSLNILEEKNVIDDHLLDIIGNDFKFDHAKGLAEWLKNSADAYIRADVPDSEQYAVFRFTDGKRNNASLECIDFVGMTETDIIKAFKRWGDPEAAKKGLQKRTYGGHGNGGKFYMRQMFDRSHFVTYRDGYLNIFGFSERRRYGFARGYKNKKMKPQEAIKLAEIDQIIFPPGIKQKILTGKTGFTVVKGSGPALMKNKVKVENIIGKFKNHPQSRRILARLNVSVIHNGNYIYDLLRPDEILPLPSFEEPRIISIPKKLSLQSGGEKITVELANPRFPQGRLILRTSEQALARGGKLGDLNRIDFIGEIGVIASYQIRELGVMTFPQAEFIYGECHCSILEDPDNDCARNDRTKLVDNETTRTLLRWIAERIEELAGEIISQEQRERSEQIKKLSSEYNEVLNRWKDRFMKKVFSEIFGGGPKVGTEGVSGLGRRHLEVPENGLAFTFVATKIPLNESWPLTLKAVVPDPIPIGTIISIVSDNPLIEPEENKITIKPEIIKLTEGGESVAVANVYVVGKRLGEKGKISARAGKYSTEMQLEVIEAKSGGGKKPKYPKVLLSSYDKDPLGIATEGTVHLSPRDPVVYQRPQDISEGIYWINTSSPLASSILKRERGGAESTRWRDYLFQRYVDIFVKEALHELQKKDPDNFRADVIDNQIMGELIRKVHAAAVIDLENLLFGDTYTPSNLTGEDKEGQENS